MRFTSLFILIFSFLAQGEESPCRTSQSDLIGSWQYQRYIFEGETRPRPNPKLLLYFDFYQTGTNRVWWTRTNENGFCERVGQFSYDPETCKFTDKIVWVNSKNNSECGMDPDMQLGKVATSRLEFVEGSLHLYFQVKGQPFIYVFDPVNEEQN